MTLLPKTGINLLDNEDYYIPDPGQMIVLTGQAQVGKTSLVLGIIANMYKSSSILVNNGELGASELLNRLASIEAGLPSDPGNRTATSASKTPNLIYVQAYDLKIVENQIAETRPDFVVIDCVNNYRQPTSWDGTLCEWHYYVSGEFARMCRDYKTVVLLVESQEGTPIPREYRLGDCMGVQDNADAVWGLSRHDANRRTLKIGKNRSGLSGVKQEIEFDENTQSYRNPTGLSA